MSLDIGTLIADRFQIIDLAGAGGMGEVYRASDVTSRKPVAIKILQSSDESDIARFQREADVLCSFEHPGIVAAVARGILPSGAPFLAMEWLEGRDLAARLRAGPLSVEESVSVVRCAATALAVAHERAIVHRDVKPSNLFLMGDRIDDVKLLDFGIARHLHTRAALTQTGAALGTPHYMAPEQATSGRDVGPAADVFSLGCVLFECLTGKPPFDAIHPLAVLAKIVFEDAPLLRSRLPSASSAMERLVSRMLEKDPARRLAHAGEVVTALDELTQGIHSDTVPSIPPRRAALTEDEQEVVCVIVIEAPSKIAHDATVAAHSWASLDTLGFRGEVLADGTIVITLAGVGQATDQAARAARGALMVRNQLRITSKRMVLATGRAYRDERGGLPVGEVIERAFRLLTISNGQDILIDEVTAGLLDHRFLIEALPNGHAFLQGERVIADESRRLLGKPTPCVGRERELGTLQSTYQACVDDSEARAVVFLAPAGFGKSRLHHEFVQRVRKRGGEFHLLIGRGDPIATSELGLVSRALRIALRIEADESIDALQAKVDTYVRQHAGAVHSPYLVAFFGELMGISFPDADLPKLRVARQDPRVLTEQMSRAFVEVCRIISSEKPLLFVLEDLHWSDSFSVDLVGTLLRELENQPIFVLALARPEVQETFPRLWSGRVEMMTLPALRPRAAGQIVREVLGENTPAEDVQRIVELSAGNALFLEELIRAVAEGRKEELPESVLAILQSRIGRLPADVRRVLRAASIFGLSCNEEGLRTLVGSTLSISPWITTLVEEEILERRNGIDYDADIEYSFRHALVRDAAYGMLIEDDRVLGHRLAAEWLVSKNADPAVIADHFYRCGALAEAIPYCVRAVEVAYLRRQPEAALHFAKLGETCGADGTDRGILVAIREELIMHMQSPLDANFAPAINLLPTSHSWWFRVLGYRCWQLLLTNKLAEAKPLLQRLLAAPVPPENAIYLSSGLWVVVAISSQMGHIELAKEVLTHIATVGNTLNTPEPLYAAHLNSARAEFMRHTRADPWQQFVLMDAAARVREAAGAHAYLEYITYGNNCAVALAELGDHEEAERILRANIEDSKSPRTGTTYALCHSTVHLADAFCKRRDLPVLEVEALVEELFRLPNLVAGFAAMSHAMLGMVFLEKRDFDRAEKSCREALDRSGHHPFRRLQLQATFVRVLVASGRSAEALEIATEAIATADRFGCAGYAEIAIRTAAALAFHAAGDTSSAETNLRMALGEIERQAQAIPDPARRRRFLHDVGDNARALALARSWNLAHEYTLVTIAEGDVR